MHAGYSFPKGNTLRKGVTLSEEHKLKLSLAGKGRKKSEEWKKKIGEARKIFFETHPEEIERKKTLIGSKNPGWKGDKVKYSGVHAWIRKNKPKSDHCEKCLQPKRFQDLEAANISGQYKRDFEDYLWLCISCHKTYDHIVENLK